MRTDVLTLCLCYVLITSIFIFDIINIFRKSKYISMYLLCKIMYCLVEGIIPSIIHIKFYNDGTLYPWNISIDYSVEGINALLIICLLVLVGYIFMSLGYRNKQKITIGNKKASISLKEKSGYKYYTILRKTATIILIVSIFSLFMWTKAYGGITKFIMNANAIRSGYTNVSNKYAFFKHFASTIVISSYAFFVLIIFSKKKKITDIMLLIISIIFSIELLLASDGRMTAGFYFISYIAIYIQSKSKLLEKKINYRTITKIAILFLLALILMLKMDDITYFIRNGTLNNLKSAQGSNLIASFMYELSFVVKSEQLAIMKANEVGIQIINDIGYGLFAWLPSSLIPSSFPRLWAINSVLAGAKTGELPCGLIAQGYYDLRLIGIVIFTFIYGKLINKIDSIEIKTPYGMVLYGSLIYSIIRLISYGMIYDFIQGLFDTFLFIIIYYAILQFTKRRSR